MRHLGLAQVAKREQAGTQADSSEARSTAGSPWPVYRGSPELAGTEVPGLRSRNRRYRREEESGANPSAASRAGGGERSGAPTGAGGHGRGRTRRAPLKLAE